MFIGLLRYVVSRYPRQRIRKSKIARFEVGKSELKEREGESRKLITGRNKDG